MIRIDPYDQDDFSVLVGFVAAIQDHERLNVPELKPGIDIGDDYAKLLLQTTDEQNGVILFARDDKQTIGFVSAWVAVDDDPLLKEEFRVHAYVSDIYVSKAWRGQRVGQILLDAVETMMLSKGCRQIRVCSKANNIQAINFYETSDYRPYKIIFTKGLKEIRPEVERHSP